MFRKAQIQKVDNSAVRCKHCRSEITFVKPSRMPAIIGAQCGKCGRHNVYAPEEIRPIQQADQRQSADAAM